MESLAALAVFSLTPVVAWGLGFVGLAWLVAPVEGLVIGVLLWHTIRELKGGFVPIARRWGPPTPLTALGALLVGWTWWDPYGNLDMLATFLASDGFLTDVLVRVFRGGLTLLGLNIVAHSMRPTEGTVARKHERRMMRQRRKDQKKEQAQPEGTQRARNH